jgi:hypothetical protein
LPTVLRVEGYRFFFFANEGSEPPHVHVESAERYAKYWLAPVVLADSVGFNGSELTDLRKMIVERAGFFEEKWHEYSSRKKA